MSFADSLPDIKAKNIDLVYSDSGNIRISLKSPLLIKSTEKLNPYTEFPKGFTVEFYNRQKQITTTLSAMYGIMYERKSLMEARSNVILHNTLSNEKLFTEKLTWDQRKELIFTDVFVKIMTESETIYGDGLESDQNFDNYTIRNPRGEFSVDIDK